MADRFNNYTIQGIDRKVTIQEILTWLFRSYIFVIEDALVLQTILFQVNGNRTLPNNVIENGGLKWAYRAYNKLTKPNKTVESSLPGLNYTSQQMFWITAATKLCGKFKPEYLENEILHNRASPSEARVTVGFSDLTEFANDFQCKVNSKMNPEKKCNVW